MMNIYMRDMIELITYYAYEYLGKGKKQFAVLEVALKDKRTNIKTKKMFQLIEDKNGQYEKVYESETIKGLYEKVTAACNI